MIVHTWHNWVSQPKQDKAWHQADIADELAELQEAKKLVHIWSELSDVVYTVTRAHWSGHELSFPITRAQRVAGHVYMFPKYSLRVLFFRRAGKKAGAKHTVQSVRNPKKVAKLEQIAQQNGLDTITFIAICQKQLRRWPLLP